MPCQKNVDIAQSRRSDFSAENAAGLAGTASSAGPRRNHQSRMFRVARYNPLIWKRFPT
jgi:hypothetical protein